MSETAPKTDHLAEDQLDAWDFSFLRQRTEVSSAEDGFPPGTINDFFARYLAVVNASMPRLEVGEWLAIFDACRNLPLFAFSPPRADSGGRGANPSSDHYMEIRLIPEELKEASQFESDLGVKWGIDIDGLSRRVEAMSFPEKMAIADAHDRFWNAPRLGQAETQAEELQELGIPIRKG